MELGLHSSSSSCPSDLILNTSPTLIPSQSPGSPSCDRHHSSDSIDDRLVCLSLHDAAYDVGGDGDLTLDRANIVGDCNDVIDNVSMSEELRIRPDEDGGVDGDRAMERGKYDEDMPEKLEIEDSERELSCGIGSDRLNNVIAVEKGGDDGDRAVGTSIKEESVLGNREIKDSVEPLSISDRSSTAIVADKGGKDGNHGVEIGKSENAVEMQEIEDREKDLSSSSTYVIPPEIVIVNDGSEDGDGMVEKEYDEAIVEGKRAIENVSKNEDSERESSGRISIPGYREEIVSDIDGNVDGTVEKDCNEENVEEKREIKNVSKNEDTETELSDRSSNRHPVRPEAENCTFFIRTGTCKFGMNCKFNHPPNHRKFQGVKAKAKEECVENTSKNVKEKVEYVDKDHIDCKYFDRPGGCKFGKACKFNHSRKPNPSLKLNFMGLPIRLGEKECPFYMRNGSCKFGANCRFNHPDPTSVGGTDALPRYDNGGSILSPKTSLSNFASWSPPSTLNGSLPYAPLMFSPIQGVPMQAEWNAYQAHVYPPERNIPIPPTYAMNAQLQEKPKEVQDDDFPERPGQPECSYFLRNGDCKYRAACKFHHPKRATAQSLPCLLSDLGLPIRPGENVCSYFSRYGICKYGPACKYDHPINHTHSSELAVSAILGDSMVKNQAMAAES